MNGHLTETNGGNTATESSRQW